MAQELSRCKISQNKANKHTISHKKGIITTILRTRDTALNDSKMIFFALRLPHFQKFSLHLQSKKETIK